MSVKISRKAYAKKYGPTTGDRIRLADSELIIEIERDYTEYGDGSGEREARLAHAETCCIPAAAPAPSACCT